MDRINNQQASSIGSPASSANKNPSLERERVRALSVGLPPGIIGNLVVGLICDWLLWGVISPGILITWSLFLLAAQIFRLTIYLMIQYSWRDLPLSRSINWVRLGALVTGLAWGSVSIFMFPGDIQYQFFLPFAIAGITGGALVSLSADKLSVYMFTFSALSPLIIRLFFEGGEVQLAMAVLALCYLIYLTAAARNGEKTFMKMFAMREQAEAGITAKNVFLANMSHEIRTPLNAIRGMAELLENPLELGESERQGVIKVINDSTENLTSILDDVLSFSQIETGLMEVNLEIASLHEALAAVVENFADEARAKHLKLSLHIDNNVPEWVNCDAFKLKQIVLNVISNALKFTQQGSIDVKVSLQYIKENSVIILIEVVDTGIGISPVLQKTLFEPFVQGEKSTNRYYGGSGLGLVISRRLARILGGDLRLESKAGHGTSVYIETELLLHKGGIKSSDQNINIETSEEAVDAPKMTRARSDKILIVDDNAINCMVLKRQLKMLGYQVEEASNGAIAFDIWRTKKFALILTDCHMPIMDGYELAQRIREYENENPKTPYTQIIAYTADVGEASQLKCSNAGMDAVLIKPVSMEMLKDCLSKQLILKQGPLEISDKKTPSVNWEKLNEITGGDREFGIKLLGSFLQEKRPDVELMLSLLKDKNTEQILLLVQGLKVASESVSAEKMLMHCKTIEAASKSGNFDFFSASMRLLPLELNHLEEYIKQLG